MSLESPNVTMQKTLRKHVLRTFTDRNRRIFTVLTLIYIASSVYIFVNFKVNSWTLAPFYQDGYYLSDQIKIFKMQTSKNETGGHPGKLSYVPRIGRLGNRLFQYASTYGLARRSGRIHSILANNKLLNLFDGITANIDSTDEGIPVVWENQSMTYSPGLIDFQSKEHVALCCYLQSWKYFYGFEVEIKQQFRFKKHFISKAQQTLLEIRGNYVVRGTSFSPQNSSKYAKVGTDGSVNFVGIHVRRGDIVEHSHLLQRGYLPAPESYIRNAMLFYLQNYENVIFVMCSDGHAWCKKVFEKDILKKSVFLVTGGSPYEDLAILSSCNHSIITVGSFGWWSAWLAGGQVTYFSKWPAPGSEFASHFNSQDYYPPNWIPLN